MLDLEKAKELLSSKTYEEIQFDTAWKWASLACVVYEFIANNPDQSSIDMWTLAEEYAHEAVEHSALVESDEGPVLLQEICSTLREYKNRARGTDNGNA